MSEDRTPHILNAASNLLGISLVIIAGLNVSHVARNSIADEIAWFAAICLATSCFLSYVALRDEKTQRGSGEKWADRIFLVGLSALLGAIVVLAIESR
jgi:small-conductance mechanosensitive channel